MVPLKTPRQCREHCPPPRLSWRPHILEGGPVHRQDGLAEGRVKLLEFMFIAKAPNGCIRKATYLA